MGLCCLLFLDQRTHLGGNCNFNSFKSPRLTRPSAQVNSSYGVFLAYYLSNNYYPGATALQFAFVGGLSISQALLVSPIATITTRLYGTRVTLLIGVFLETLALIGASFSREIWQLFLSQGVCFGFGMGFLFVGSVCGSCKKRIYNSNPQLMLSRSASFPSGLPRNGAWPTASLLLGVALAV